MIELDGEVVSLENYGAYNAAIVNLKEKCDSAVQLAESFMESEEITAVLAEGNVQYVPLFENVSIVLETIDTKGQERNRRQLLVNLSELEMAIYNLTHWIEVNRSSVELALAKTRFASMRSVVQARTENP